MYRTLSELPCLPDHLLQAALDLLHPKAGQDIMTPPDPGYASRKLYINNQCVSTTVTTRFTLPEPVQSWIRQNVVDDFTECSISISPVSKGNIHGAHVDQHRDALLIYPITTGGQNCMTTWYLEKDKPKFRPVGAKDYVTDYAALTVVDQTQFPVKQWTVFNTRCMHGVENIVEDRIAIQIGIPSTHYLYKLVSAD